MALLGFDVQIHQSHAPKTNFSRVRPRKDFFYSLNAQAQPTATRGTGWPFGWSGLLAITIVTI
jgi:hypothetical protein